MSVSCHVQTRNGTEHKEPRHRTEKKPVFCCVCKIKPQEFHPSIEYRWSETRLANIETGRVIYTSGPRDPRYFITLGSFNFPFISNQIPVSHSKDICFLNIQLKTRYFRHWNSARQDVKSKKKLTYNFMCRQKLNEFSGFLGFSTVSCVVWVPMLRRIVISLNGAQTQKTMKSTFTIVTPPHKIATEIYWFEKRLKAPRKWPVLGRESPKAMRSGGGGVRRNNIKIKI
jgi:hypothetical protein